MEVYDKVIKDTRKLLSPYTPRELTVGAPHNWNLLEENEFLMKRDIAFELGIRQKPSTCYNAPTSSSDIVSEDKILLYGKDLPEIKKDVTFTRITFLNVDEDKDPNRTYQNIKRLEFARFRLIPEGYMILSSSMENKEQVRVSKKAIKKGLNFTTIGNLIIDKYKENYGVNNVQVIFITEEIPEIKELVNQSKKVDEITNAFDHILKDVILDCDLCPLHPICDDVEALRKLHFEVNHSEEEYEVGKRNL